MIEKIIGAKIKKVWSKVGVKENEYDLEYDDIEVFIELDNGLIINLWASEWGGMTLRKKCKSCGRLIRFEKGYIYSPHPFPDGDICYDCWYKKQKRGEKARRVRCVDVVKDD